MLQKHSVYTNIKNMELKNNYYSNHFAISGTMRSGTTLMSSILNSYDQIVVIPDILKWFWAYLYKRYGDFNTKYQMEKALFELDYYIKAGLNNSRKELYDKRIIQNEVLKHGVSYKTLYNTLVKYYSEGISNNLESVIGFKATQQHNSYDQIINSFYNFKIVHMVRNCRDTYFSHKNYPGNNPKNSVIKLKRKVKNKIRKKLDIQQYINHERFFFQMNPLNLIDEWVVTQKKVLEIKEKYPENIIIIKYEDLITNPESTIEELLKRLKVEEAKISVDYDSLKDIDGNKFIANTSHKQETNINKLDTSRIYNSFNKLSSKEIEYYYKKASELEKKMGYIF